MKLKLSSLGKILLIVLISSSCSESGRIKGNWSAISSEGDYSELYLNRNQIQIFTEVGGNIASQQFEIVNDSLKTNILNYKMDWINPDSVVLKSETFTLNLLRVKNGFKLSDYTGESSSQQYADSFYNRMIKTKGIKTDSSKSTSQKYQEIEKETIELNRE